MQTPPKQNPALAATLIFVATAFIAGSTLFAKTLGTDTFGPPLHPLQVSQGRFMFAFMGFATAAIILRPRFDKVHWRLHLGRTSAAWLGVTLMFASVAYIPMSDATALSFMSPVFALILATPLLGETVGRVRWSAAMFAMLGALVLIRPTPASFQPAALLALGAALMMGLETICIKALAGRERPFQILLINNLLGVTIASIAALFVWQAPTLAQWGALAAVGGLMACAQVCFINGMARADASFVSPFVYATLVFASLYDFLIYGERPGWVSILGAAIILAGALMLALREARLRSGIT